MATTKKRNHNIFNKKVGIRRWRNRGREQNGCTDTDNMRPSIIMEKTMIGSNNGIGRGKRHSGQEKRHINVPQANCRLHR